MNGAPPGFEAVVVIADRSGVGAVVVVIIWFGVRDATAEAGVGAGDAAASVGSVGRTLVRRPVFVL